MKDKTSVFYNIISLLARSQTCFDTIVRVMLIMLRKNTRNNILIGGMRVCERDQHLNESIQRERRYSQIRDYLDHDMHLPM